MRTSIPTKLSLLDFAKILGVHPLHFAQVKVGDQPSLCEQVYFQYSWQDHDRISREEISRAIADAEENVERLLNYRLAPSWEVDEWRATSQSYRAEFVNYTALNVRNFAQSVRANWGYFISGGIQAKTLIDAEATIVYSDADADGYDETATVTVTVPTGTEACELTVFYPGKDGDDAWEIRPLISVVVTGVTAVLVFRREQAVTEILQESYDPEPVEGTTDDNFLEEVDVYRRWNDPQTQATLGWEPTGSCACGSGGCPSCSFSSQTACLHLRGDDRNSILAYSPATWVADDEDFDVASLAMPRNPDVVRLYYYAGWRDKRRACTREMDEAWKRTIAYLACSMLDRPLCDCKADFWQYWRQDMSLVSAGEGIDQFQISAGDLENPLGTRRGMIYAWRRVNVNSPVGRAILL